MKPGTLLAGAAATFLSFSPCSPAEKPETTAEMGRQDYEGKRLSEAIGTVESTKDELPRALGLSADMEGYQVFNDEYGRPTTVACTVDSSESDAYHHAAAAARGTISELRKGAVTGFINDSRTKEVGGGTVACVKSTATSIEDK